MQEYRREVWKITEYRDGAVYKTEKVCDLWLEVKPRTGQEEKDIARKHGGDILASTMDYR